MSRADRRLHRLPRLAAVAFAVIGISAAFPVIAAAGPAPSPSPSPGYNPQACNNSNEFVIQYDIATCVSDAAGAAASWVSDQAIQNVANWITTAAASGSASLLGQLNQEATHPELNAPWFNSVYYGGGGAPGHPGQAGSKMPGAVVIAAWLVIAIVIASLLAGVIRGDPVGMIRLLLLRLPVAILLTYIATWLIALLLDLTDIASGWVLRGGISGLQQWTSQIQGQGIGSDFLSVVASLALIVATLLGYLELLARDAAIYIVTAFIPLIAAASLWPGAHNALKRGAETLFVLCVSKFVLVFVLVLGAAALTAPDVHSFSPLLTGMLIFLIAAFAPAAIFRLVPILEASAVAGLAGGASRFGRDAARSGHGVLGAGLAGAGGATRWLRDRIGPQAASAGTSGPSPGGGDLSIAGLRGGPGGSGGDGGGGSPGAGPAGPASPGGSGSGPAGGDAGSGSAAPPADRDGAGGPELAGLSSGRGDRATREGGS